MKGVHKRTKIGRENAIQRLKAEHDKGTDGDYIDETVAILLRRARIEALNGLTVPLHSLRK